MLRVRVINESETRAGEICAGLALSGHQVAALLLALAVGAGADAPLYVPVAIPRLAAAVLGRALFYVLVIPTTMPGAFFWRNPGFVEHARQTGLASMPQLGIVPDGH